MPRRWLDSSFFADEKVGRLAMNERQLFAAIIANQDDDGRLKGHPAYLRSIAFPYDEFNTDEVKQMRDHIAEINANVIIYQDGAEEYIQLKRHKRYQKPRYYHPSKLPTPPGWPFDEPDPDGDHQVTDEPPHSSEMATEVSLPSNQTATKVSPNSSHIADEVSSSSRQAVTKQYTEDRGGVGLDLDLDLGKGKGILSSKESLVSPSEATSLTKRISRLKPHQQEAGIFLDMVQQHEGMPLLSRPKLIHLVRTKLFKDSRSTPEKLLKFYRWLKENDGFFHNKAPPQVIGGMPDRYPSWLGGKLTPEGGKSFEQRKPGRDSGDGEHRRDPLAATRARGWKIGGEEPDEENED
jgi:hypothetical protein